MDEKGCPLRRGMSVSKYVIIELIIILKSNINSINQICHLV